MTNDCICSNVPRIWRLAGVTRTVRLTVTKDGSPYDFTGLQTVLRIDRDNSDFHYEPQFTVEGDDNNIIVFAWAADKQPLGDYTIEVTVTDGSGNKDRVNWHGATGVRLVEYSNLVKGEDAAGVESDSELGLDGIFTMNGVGMDAYEEWLADGNEGSLHDYILWMQGPAREAAEAAEATMTEIQSRADDDHTTAGSDHTRAAADHTTATGDHTRAEEDHTRAISDHTRAAQDHTSAVGDHMTAGQDHLRAEADHTTAGSDHTRAESDHATAASDHSTAASDHTKAGQDSTRAGSDHDIAVADHAQAEADHTRAEGDHTTAAADHTTAASDHTTAAADHTQATADHAVMAGYDTRLTNVETDVTQLGQEVAEISPAFFGNVDISGFDALTLFPNGANWLVNNNYKCKFLKCIPGSTYYITANATNYSHITFVKSIGSSGQPVDYATGYSDIVAITTGQTKSFVAPSDAVYMCIAVLEVSDRTPTAIVQQTLKDEINESISELQNTKADLVKQVGKNLFDKTKIVTGYYIVYSNGSLAADSDSSVSGLIPIEPGEVYHIHRPGIVGTGAVRFLAADNTVLIPQKVDGTAWSNYEPTNGDTGNTYQECKVKAPGTAVYIQFTTQFNGNGNLDATQIEKGADFTSYEPYIEKMVLSPSELPSQAIKKWTGKKWVAVGDSLTEVNAKTTKNYHAYISDETGISVVNMGLSGSGYHTLYDTNRAFYQRVASIPTDADVITIFGSGNDLTFAASNLGSPEDTTTDTICGCVNTTLDTILSVYMASGKVPVIGVITPTPWSGNTPDNPTCTMALYSNAIIECCKRKSIPVLDLYHESNLHPGNATFRTLAYSRDGGGGVHPDERGHEIIAPMIEKFLGGLINP